jgi:hypothetical protein
LGSTLYTGAISIVSVVSSPALSSPEGLWGLENHMLQDELQKRDRDRLIFRLVGQNLELFYALLVD